MPKTYKWDSKYENEKTFTVYFKRYYLTIDKEMYLKNEFLAKYVQLAKLDDTKKGSPW